MFQSRQHAGQQLAKELAEYAGKKNTVVLGIPRGGVIVAAEVAQNLRLPLDIIVTRKIADPRNAEYALGAIDEEANWYFNEEIVPYADKNMIDAVIEKEKREVERRVMMYRGTREFLNVNGKKVIVVDDGIATGFSVLAATVFAKIKGAKQVIVATPVIAPDSIEVLEHECDILVYLEAPVLFMAVGQFYEEYKEVSDEEVVKALKGFQDNKS